MNQLDLFDKNLSDYQYSIYIRDQAIWEKLGTYTVQQAIEIWLSTLRQLTQKNYAYGLTKLEEIGCFKKDWTLAQFAMVNHDAVIDKIKLVDKWAELTRQARAACYISFTGFLARRFGLIKKAIPCKEGTNKTFYKVRDKVVTNAISQQQWLVFFKVLASMNQRECLIAKLALQGAKRISEVLNLTTDRINWEKNEISYVQSKMGGLIKEIVITYPKTIMDELKELIGDRTGFVFVTKNGLQVRRERASFMFKLASQRAGFGKLKVTPHVLRCSAITYLKQNGFSDASIQKMTGHSKIDMMNEYDKSSIAENASKQVCLIY